MLAMSKPSTGLKLCIAIFINIYFIFVAGLIHTVPEAPEFQQGNQTEVVVRPKGTILRLRCEVNANPPAIVTWYRNDKKLVLKWPRVRLRRGSNMNVLIIKNLGSLDSGDYDCKATNKYGDISKTYTVSVVEPRFLQPSSTSVQPSVLDVRCGTTTELKCKFYSEFPTHIQWLLEVPPNSTHEAEGSITVKSKQYVVLPNTATEDSTLRLPNTTLRHQGRITCLVVNSFGYSHSSAMIKVLPKTGLPTFVNGLYDLDLAMVTPNFTLECIVNVPSFMGYYITWAKEGEKVDPEVFVFHERNKTRQLDRCVAEISSRITFKPLVQGHWLAAKDGGDYSCLVHNSSGSIVSKELATVVFEEPKSVLHQNESVEEEEEEDTSEIITVTPTRTTAQEGESVAFYCYTKGDLPTVVWLLQPDATVPICDVRQTLQIDQVNYRLIGPGEMWSRDDRKYLNILRIDNVSREHAGTYVCYVVQSSSRQAATLNVIRGMAGPKIVPPFMGNRTFFVGDLALMQCRAKSDGKPIVQWYKEVDDGYNETETSTVMDRRVIPLFNPEPAWETGGVFLSVFRLLIQAEENQGKYICFWFNSHGEDVDHGYIRVKRKRS